MKCSYNCEYKHNTRTCPTRKNDINGRLKQVKTRAKTKNTNEVSLETVQAQGTVQAGETVQAGGIVQAGQSVQASGKTKVPAKPKAKTGPSFLKKQVPNPATRVVRETPATQAGGSQGGMFNTPATTTRPIQNTPLGIQPENFNSKQKLQVTSLWKSLADKKKRLEKLRKNSVWKI